MDGESSYESDISESWSLIDINLNEESLLPVTESLESPTSELKNEKPGTRDDEQEEIEDFVRKCKETNKAEFSRVSDSESGSLFKSQVDSCDRTDDNFLGKKNFSDDGTNDSGDSESIEILEIDGSYRDSELDRLDDSSFDQVEVSTYQSDDDDEESVEGKNNIENRNNNSTVIRRRKRLSRSSEDDVHSVNSENKSSKKKIESCTGIQEPSEASTRANCTPVYKHYRNNVVNTVLSLSVGVIFAGVACLAIGHFLGVQDASEAAVELTETLKKLQEENAALQSALINLEMNSKSELPLPQQQQQSPPQELPTTEEHPQTEPTKPETNKVNKAALSAVRSSFNSIEWLSKLQSFIRKNNHHHQHHHNHNANEGENKDFNGLGKYILGQVHSLNRRMEEGAKFFEDADKKISKYLHRIIRRLSSSQDNIEILHERLIKLKNTLSNKLDMDSQDESQRLGRLHRRVPVTELELQTMQWRPEKRPRDKKSLSEQTDYRKSILFYNFPQPEKYYKNNSLEKEDIESTEQHEKTVRDDKQGNKTKPKVETKEEKKKDKKKQYKKEKKKQKKNKKIETPRDNQGKKRGKWAVNKLEKVLKNMEKSRRKDKSGRLTFSEVALNLTRSQTKKYSKPGEKTPKHRRKCKRSKHPKAKKVFLGDLKRESTKREQYSRVCSGPECFNLTGHWVFRWADGREEYRRHQAVGEWQFERAKARKELRDYNYEDENWQFKRAVAREYNRWNRGKYEKYFGKDFFHEKFSWI